jgi:hypothetical protein
LGKFWRVLPWKMLIYYMTIWSILQLFGILCGDLVYLNSIWYIVPRKIWQTLDNLDDGKRTHLQSPAFVPRNSDRGNNTCVVKVYCKGKHISDIYKRNNAVQTSLLPPPPPVNNRTGRQYKPSYHILPLCGTLLIHLVTWPCIFLWDHVTTATQHSTQCSFARLPLCGALCNARFWKCLLCGVLWYLTFRVAL